MAILAIETATEACSVAIEHNSVLLFDHRVLPRQHNLVVLAMIEGLLARAGAQRSDLEIVGFGCGPGSFTGVRIAASVAQGLAFALSLAVVRVSTLEVLAHTALRSVPHARGVVVGSASRADEMFLAAFRVRSGVGQTVLERIVDDRIVKQSAVMLPEEIGEGWYAAGDRVEALSGLVTLGTSGIRHPQARDLIALARRESSAGRAVAADVAWPVYLDGDGPWRGR